MEALGRTFWLQEQHAVAITDHGGVIIDWSPGAVLVSGMPAEQALGRLLGELRGAPGPEATADLLAQAEREPVSAGAWRERPGGERWWAEAMVVPLRDSDGITIIGFAEILRDETARVLDEAAQAEADRRFAEALRAARRLAEAEELAQVGSWERDLVRGVSYWSPGIFALYGLDPDTVTPSLEVFLDVVHPDDREEVEAVIRQAETNGGAYEIEHRAVRTDGRVRWIYSRAEVLEAGSDGPLRIAGNARDVTEAHRVGVALRDAAERINPQPQPEAEVLSAKLSARQLEILALVADGLSNLEIADRLFISEATVKWHMRQILRALGVSNRAQAVARYLRAGRA